MTDNDVAQAAMQHGFHLNTVQSQQLADYMNDVLRWNKAMNLVGAMSWRALFSTLIIDSLRLAPFLEQLDLPDAPTCWDLGAGAGLPGIPLRLLWPRGTYWLVDSREKRALFMQTCIARLRLPNVHVYQGRAEAFMPANGAANLILSRAFMPWRDLLAFVEPHLAAHGYLVLLLREDITPILASTPSQPEAWRITHHTHYAVGDITRYFFALQKHPA